MSKTQTSCEAASLVPALHLEQQRMQLSQQSQRTKARPGLADPSSLPITRNSATNFYQMEKLPTYLDRPHLTGSNRERDKCHWLANPWLVKQPLPLCWQGRVVDWAILPGEEEKPWTFSGKSPNPLAELDQGGTKQLAVQPLDSHGHVNYFKFKQTK